MQNSSPRKRRYMGMTGAQIGALVVMSLFICGILGVGGFLVLQDRLPATGSEAKPLRPQPTYTPLPTYTPFPTNTPLSRFPPTWTPTPMNDCTALLTWSNDNKILLNQIQATSDELFSFMSTAARSGKLDPETASTLRKFATRYQNAIASLREQSMPSKYQGNISAWLAAFTGLSDSLQKGASAIELKDSNAIATAGQKVSDSFAVVEGAAAPIAAAYEQCKK